MSSSSLPEGLYDLLLTHSQASHLDGDASDVHLLAKPDPALVADHLARQLASILEDLPTDADGTARQQQALVNALLLDLRQRLP